MTILVIALYGLVVPYVGLMLLIIIGLLRPERKPQNRDTPSVSVIIPAHNEEVNLPATLSSLAQQTYPGELEFVIIDDRSSDATEKIIQSFVKRDDRFKLIKVMTASRRFAPKVHAVQAGIANSVGDIIITSDADCRYPRGWITGLVSYFESDVVMVLGYVESTRAYRCRDWLERFESSDWLSLMLTSKALTKLGWKFASSANNQAYRRNAFNAVGGFGANGRAPSGDEDLFAQRLGRLTGKKILFAGTPATRVLTQPMPTLTALLQQRRRWVSRYQYIVHYHPIFLLGIGILGFQSIVLSASVVLSLFYPPLRWWVFSLWSVKLVVELIGMAIGTKQLQRRDLWGLPTIFWALLHPFFIATVSIWSLIKSNERRAETIDYRRRYFMRQLRELRRKVKGLFQELYS
jgi:cellulose synthase/poly-beta-1,6-N-acetylglucosamine synthase-like glycosyltransferase